MLSVQRHVSGLEYRIADEAEEVAVAGVDAGVVPSRPTPCMNDNAGICKLEE